MFQTTVALLQNLFPHRFASPPQSIPAQTRLLWTQA
jgi:hypothetical protein